MIELNLTLLPRDEWVACNPPRPSPKRKAEAPPGTPPETKALRALIDDAFDTQTEPPETVLHRDHERIEFKEICKHAGLFREYGGIKGWMQTYGYTVKQI